MNWKFVAAAFVVALGAFAAGALLYVWAAVATMST